MHLRRIEIPGFRVLKDVVMEFPSETTPQVFPLASENGGGKSTLLQFLFTLLHCAVDETRKPYLAALMSSHFQNASEAKQLVARLTLELEGETHTLSYYSLGPAYLAEKFDEPNEYLQFDLKATLTALRGDFLAPELAGGFQHIQDQINRYAKAEKLVQRLLSTMGWLRLVDFEAKETRQGPLQNRALVCRVDGLDIAAAQRLLEQVSSQISLLGPAGQQYIFLDRYVRAGVFKGGIQPYFEHLHTAMNDLPTFLAQDQLNADFLIRVLDRARKQDFGEVINTGKYGSRYTTILGNLNSFLVNKRIKPHADENGELTGVSFITDGPKGEVELDPEDLSRGELKRLMVYAWLKSNPPGTVTLIDELEASFHPDWQTGVARDLQDWAPDNQYILATHSYELCQMLTPRHVRELEPRLQPKAP